MKIRKKAVTLIELMIVIFIIGIIGSVIGYNMKGSLDEGRAFKSEQGSKMVHDILTLAMADSTATMSQILSEPKKFLEQSGLVGNPKKVLKDGWNQPYQIRKVNNQDFVVYSKKWEEFLIKKKKLDPAKCQEEYSWAFYNEDAEPEEEE